MLQGDSALLLAVKLNRIAAAADADTLVSPLQPEADLVSSCSTFDDFW